LSNNLNQMQALLSKLPDVGTHDGVSEALEKRSWTWEGSLADHIRTLLQVPFFILAAIVLPPQACAIIHLSVESKYKSQFFSKLQGELGRMAGLNDVEELVSTGNLSGAESSDFGCFADYGRAFAKKDGIGDSVQEKYDVIAEKHSNLIARCAQGLAFFAFWGSLAGNTVEGYLRGTLFGKKKEGSNAIFESFFVLYYIIFFLITDLIARILKLMSSEVVAPISILMRIVISFIALSWVLPYGLLSCGAFVLGRFFDVETFMFLKNDEDNRHDVKYYLGGGSSYWFLP